MDTAITGGPFQTNGIINSVITDNSYSKMAVNVRQNESYVLGFDGTFTMG